MPLTIVQADLTTMQVDAIVNAANTRLAQGGGVCGAIFHAAGAEKLTQSCREIGHCSTGDAVLTPGFDLPARFIIHTAGPVWQGGTNGEELLLRSCYLRSLALAQQHGLHSVAFPLISSGIYGYPKQAALEAAVSAICGFLRDEDMTVMLAIFDPPTFALCRRQYPDLIGE